MKLKKNAVLTVLSLLFLTAICLYASEENGNEKPITIGEACKSAVERIGENYDVGKTVEFYKSNFAEKLKLLEKDLKDKSDDVISEIVDDLNECNEIMALNENPEEFKKAMEFMRAEIRADILSDKISELRKKDAEKNKLEIDKTGKALKDELRKIFDAKIQKEKKNMKDLEGQLDAMKNRIKKREVNREKIIQKKFNELTDANDDEDLTF